MCVSVLKSLTLDERWPEHVSISGWYTLQASIVRVELGLTQFLRVLFTYSVLLYFPLIQAYES